MHKLIFTFFFLNVDAALMKNAPQPYDYQGKHHVSED